jgi:hypothetical protein
MSSRCPITWRCVISDKRMRPYGMPMTEGCGHLNWQNTTKIDKKPTKKNPWLGKCKNCGRKKRLNRGNVSMWETVQDAKNYCQNNSDEVKVIPLEQPSQPPYLLRTEPHEIFDETKNLHTYLLQMEENNLEDWRGE